MIHSSCVLDISGRPCFPLHRATAGEEPLISNTWDHKCLRSRGSSEPGIFPIDSPVGNSQPQIPNAPKSNTSAASCQLWKSFGFGSTQHIGFLDWWSSVVSTAPQFKNGAIEYIPLHKNNQAFLTENKMCSRREATIRATCTCHTLPSLCEGKYPWHKFSTHHSHTWRFSKLQHPSFKTEGVHKGRDISKHTLGCWIKHKFPTGTLAGRS